MLGLLGVVAITASALPGCVSDPDCGVCDPSALVLETIAGVNYAGKLVKLLGPACEGDGCPGAITSGKYFVETIMPCTETDAAIAAGRGTDEWCKISPLVVDSGIQFIFNNLLDPTSVELVRKQPEDPRLLEVYDWKTHIVHLEGPVTRFNGDYRPGATPDYPDRVPRAVNLACIDNLAELGRAFDHTVLAANPSICDGTYAAEDGKIWPLKAELARKDAAGEQKPTTVETYEGELDTRSLAQSCSPPQSGVDSCCDACDYEVAVNVSKYGVTQAVDEMTPAAGRRRTDRTAIPCDPMGDKFTDCAGFIPHVYRGHELRSFEYDWDGDGARERFRVPLHDKLRETHPNERPAGREQATVPCDDSQDCTSELRAHLAGTECVGTDPDGQACWKGEDCQDKRCVAEWFGDCRADATTTGAGGFCVDRRWNGYGVAGCFTTTASFQVCADEKDCQSFEGGAQPAGSRLSLADVNTDGELSAVEACRRSLDPRAPDAGPCDPYFQASIEPIPRHDRNEGLPSATRECICEDRPPASCQAFVDQLCRVDGDPNKPIVAEKQGQYAFKFVGPVGGVIYDPAIKGVQFLPADLGKVPRSLVEACAASRTNGAGGLSIKDGWRANDGGAETFENFDRAMCSSAEYKVVFTTPRDGERLEHIRDKVGNTLAGKSTYIVHTPDFHVVPGSGFPTDNLRIGACDEFQIGFSNKYDLDPANLKKLQIVRISADGEQELEVVAGGLDCSTKKDSGVPCLTTNIRDQKRGAIRVSIDTRTFGAGVLVAKQRYRLKVPGLTLAPGETVHDVIARDPGRYNAAFWDACGMPLVTSMPLLDPDGAATERGRASAPDHFYDFDIDKPVAREDRDHDNIQFSCDNAPNDFNPDQGDMDGDGFGDVVDSCPTVGYQSSEGDSDRDGIGSLCDRCPRTLMAYNKQGVAAGAPVRMLVRNIPVQDDFDQDGIGDVCDNCIVKANCGEFGPAAEGLEPAGISSQVPSGDTNVCQTDNMLPFIGDACVVDGAAIQLAGAAGPVGHGNDDDFDQDGLANAGDWCPRLRVERFTCSGPEDCPPGAECSAGICNHVDTDGDHVGDRCDTCPARDNPNQVQDGGLQSDDPDGDFVGTACEADSACDNKINPRRIAFYSRVSNGQCCVTTFSTAAGLMDPGYVEIDERTGACTVIDPVLPISADCSDEQNNVSCRQLPRSVLERPGVVQLPAGCEQAGTVLTLDSPGIEGDEDKLYAFMCLMPQADQDFDGIGDSCDLCAYSFDPYNSLYKDENNKVWPSYGKFCSGAYDADLSIATCADAPHMDTDTDTASSGSSGG